MNNNSIIGNTYNYLTVLRRVGDHVTSGGNKFPAYECQCVCGRHKVVVAAKLKNGHVKSCGQCGIFSTKKDLSGKRFDKLFVIRENGYYEYPNGERDYKWLCRCDCGNYVTIRGNSLKSIEFFGGLSSYYYTVYHDALKRMYAEANGYVYVAVDCDRKSDENIIEQLKQQVVC